MKEIMIATKNKGKIKEFQAMFGDDWKVLSLLDKPFDDIDETGSSFEENAKLKAETVRDAWNCPVIADDSGLVIDALNGRPGIYSARYAGVDKDDDANMDKVLAEMEGIEEENRTARFVCVIAVATLEETHVFHGTCEGMIATSKQGNNGFGYDPIFYIPEKRKTMAQLSAEEKNAISHRHHALEKLRRKWMDIFRQ